LQAGPLLVDFFLDATALAGLRLDLGVDHWLQSCGAVPARDAARIRRENGGCVRGGRAVARVRAWRSAARRRRRRWARARGGRGGLG
jgi:hypothetical protein